LEVTKTLKKTSAYSKRLKSAIASEATEAWLLKHQHRNTLGQQCTFKKRRWLIPIYVDQAFQQVFMKSVQCGISTYLFVKTIKAMMDNKQVIYAVPNDEDRNELVLNVFNPVVDSVPLYKRNNNGVNNVGIKKFFGGGVKFVSSRRPTAFFSTPAQVVIIDEMDKCHMHNLKFSKDRTASTRILLDEDPVHIWVSNPTHTKHGIHSKFLLSDQKYYNFKCGHCGEWQDLDFFTNVVRMIDEYKFELVDTKYSTDAVRDVHCLCRKCGGIIDRHNDIQDWVKKRPSITDVSGYQISQLFTEQFLIREIVREFELALNGDETDRQVFWNSKLGLPYSGAGAHISEDDIRECIVDDYTMPKKSEYTVAGLDTGIYLQLAIDELVDGTRRRAVFRDKLTNWDDIKNICHRFNVRCMVIDAQGDIHAPREFARNFKQYGVWLCEYIPADRVSAGEWKPVERYDGGGRRTKFVQVNRTESIDSMVASIQGGIVIYPKNIIHAQKGEFVEHMTAPKRISIVSKDGRKRFIWDEDGQPDHAFHAENYVHLAARMKKFRQGSMSMMATD
jgi:hypothetical protein